MLASFVPTLITTSAMLCLDAVMYAWGKTSRMQRAASCSSCCPPSQPALYCTTKWSGAGCFAALYGIGATGLRHMAAKHSMITQHIFEHELQ